MMQKKKAEYQTPQIIVVETIMCNMLCGSIAISDEEVNYQGRVNQRREPGAWSEEMWNQKN